MPNKSSTTQAVFTHKIHNEAQSRKLSLSALNPLDSQTYTRFINLPISTDRNIPYAFFYPNDSLLSWDGSNADYPNSRSGFRLSVRVEI